MEFAPATALDARVFAQKRAGELNLKIGVQELDRLVEATAADLARLANELDKLTLFAASRDGVITEHDIAALVPNLSETTIFCPGERFGAARQAGVAAASGYFDPRRRVSSARIDLSGQPTADGLGRERG